MSLSNDALTELRARRCDLYEQLRLIDKNVAAIQRSPFFSTRAGNAVTMRESIDGLEEQIIEIDRQISRARGQTFETSGDSVDLG